MIAVEGIYDNGKLLLEKLAPVNKAKVLVIFPDNEKTAKDIIENKKRPKRNDAFLKALEDDKFVIHTGLNVEEYMRELRKDERIF